MDQGLGTIAALQFHRSTAVVTVAEGRPDEAESWHGVPLLPRGTSNLNLQVVRFSRFTSERGCNVHDH